MYTGEYPLNWVEISNAKKDAAGWCCENCHHPHDPMNNYSLTVHHLDRNKSNCSPENLVALCQRCHLEVQARYWPGQGFLFGAPEWARKRGLDYREFFIPVNLIENNC